MASFLGWGTVADYFAYFNVVSNAWIGETQPGTNWHHFTTINYLSGPNVLTFDLKVDGVLVGEKLPFRHVILLPTTSVGRLRVGAIRGTAPGEFGEIDNLVITAQPLSAAVAPVSISNPVHTGSEFKFSFASQNGVNYVARYRDSLSTGIWQTLITISGDGSVKVVTDPNPSSDTRFYQIITQ
jgi:hypothetical protein